MNAVEVKNLKFSYDNQGTVIDDISFSVSKGSYVSVLGHNGSGKSTLSKLLIGLLKKDSGSISIGGIELSKETQREIRRHTAIVFQNPDNQFIGATVEDDIAFGLENRQIPQPEMVDLVKEYSTKVGMSAYLEKEPSFLSGGQKQRVAIAGALALKPDLLILDEATSMLDPTGKREINELINLMRKDNPELTVLSITHDIEETLNSDQIIILNKGKIVASGETNKILSDRDLLIKNGIKPPFIYELNAILKDKEIIDKNCKTIEEAVNKLCK